MIRDMVSVAQHRQWEALHVRGSMEFRREVWLEAGARGVEVQGYQPNDLDRQALADRREVWDRAHARSHDEEARSASDRNRRADQLDYDKGLSGRLVEVGRAPYRNRTNETSTYVTIELEDGRHHQAWGVGLDKAAGDSSAKPLDHVQVRRDGVERVAKRIEVIDAASGVAAVERRQVARNHWRVTAERFRAADRRAAARDPDLVAAQSQLVVVENSSSAHSKGRAHASETHRGSQGAHSPTPRKWAFLWQSDSVGACSGASSVDTRWPDPPRPCGQLPYPEQSGGNGDDGEVVSR
ncbi:LPD7 domain-containing protein, partial [Bradyrhizobium sp. 31Argb]|uniref:LPD7 domain-containing protein n=1 Tax=Bradyrhizobium sp. 31Argb TaxID=3141247 RepID=UPI00374A466B